MQTHLNLHDLGGEGVGQTCGCRAERDEVLVGKVLGAEPGKVTLAAESPPAGSSLEPPGPARCSRALSHRVS